MTDPWADVRERYVHDRTCDACAEEKARVDQILTDADALFPLVHLGEVLMASLSGLRQSVHPQIQRAIRDFDDALVAIPERLK